MDGIFAGTSAQPNRNSNTMGSKCALLTFPAIGAAATVKYPNSFQSIDNFNWVVLGSSYGTCSIIIKDGLLYEGFIFRSSIQAYYTIRWAGNAIVAESSGNITNPNLHPDPPGAVCAQFFY